MAHHLLHQSPICLAKPSESPEPLCGDFDDWLIHVKLPAKCLNTLTSFYKANPLNGALSLLAQLAQKRPLAFEKAKQKYQHTQCPNRPSVSDPQAGSDVGRFVNQDLVAALALPQGMGPIHGVDFETGENKIRSLHCLTFTRLDSNVPCPDGIQSKKGPKLFGKFNVVKGI